MEHRENVAQERAEPGVTPERWQQIKESIASLERCTPGERAASLAELRAKDSELCLEVEGFLKHDSADSFLEHPAVAGMPMSPGSRLGQYEIEAPLGAGGMGEVYRARDTTLRRTVAIKILTEADERSRVRLLREARAASALNHPNICTIYEVGQDGETSFIAMEHVEGRSLDELIPAGGLPRQSLISYGSQIADALAHAHGQSIVHRDLKPLNVQVTPQGRVKVLDFGLAKRLVEADPDGLTMTAGTEADVGTVAGTFPYMAPEVLRAEEATTRSDLWALGVMLYEMASGRRPFDGSTRADTVSSILRDTPEPLPTHVSSGLRSIIQRCLNREPAQRYAHASAIEAALEAIHSDSAVAEPTWVEEPRRLPININWRLVAVGSAGALLVVLLAGLAYLARGLLPSPTDTTVARLANPIQITTAVGWESYPAWSPDSQILAYVSDEAGNPDIWVAQVGGGPAINRTADNNQADVGASWSPTGREIAFASVRGGDSGSVFVMPALAGSARRVSSSNDMTTGDAPQFVDSGSSLAYRMRTTARRAAGDDDLPTAVEIVSIASGETRTLLLPGTEGRGAFGLSWSPDRRFLAYSLGATTTSTTPLRIVRVADGEGIEITDASTWNAYPSWAPDGRTLYFVSDRVGARDLWQQRLSEDGRPEGDPESVSVGIGMSYAAVSPDGTKLAYSQGLRITNAWRVPIPDDEFATWEDAEQLTFDQASTEDVDVSRDGAHLLLGSNRGGNSDIWMLSLEGRQLKSGGIGGQQQQVSLDLANDASPRWSPDGEFVAFESTRGGGDDIWVKPVAGGVARQLTTDPARDVEPEWSPSGTEIAFMTARQGQSGIWIVNVETGVERELVENAEYPAWSPDGRWIVYQNDDGLWRVSPEGGTPEQLTATLGERPQWAFDGQMIYYRHLSNIWRLSLDDGTERRLTDLGGDRRGGFEGSMSTDGQYIYFPWSANLGDIWVMDVLYEER